MQARPYTRSLKTAKKHSRHKYLEMAGGARTYLRCATVAIVERRGVRLVDGRQSSEGTEIEGRMQQAVHLPSGGVVASSRTGGVVRGSYLFWLPLPPITQPDRQA